MQNLPTDNLYKFLTVLGLVMAIGAGSLWIKAEADMDTYAEEHYKVATEFAISVQKYVTETNKIIKFIKDNGGYEGATRETINTVGQMLKSIDPISTKANELSQEMVGPQFLYQKRVERYEYIKAASIAGLIVGIILSLVGAFLWYSRHQRHLDEKVKVGIT